MADRKRKRLGRQNEVDVRRSQRLTIAREQADERCASESVEKLPARLLGMVNHVHVHCMH